MLLLVVSNYLYKPIHIYIYIHLCKLLPLISNLIFCHFITFIETGLLSLLGRSENAPLPPQNLLADFAGGGLLCAMGIAMALFEREKSNKGQIIDSAMVEGSAYIGSWIFKSRDMPVWSGVRGKSW